MVRIAFVTACILTVLSVLAIAVEPVIGLGMSIMMGSIAWGIRRGVMWAALFGCFVTAAPAVRVAAEDLRGNWLTVAFNLAAATVFLLAALRSTDRKLKSGWLLATVLAALFFLTLRPFVMPTGSMEKTLLVGDRFFVETISGTTGRTPQRDEIIVVHYPVDPKQTFVKRVAGVPGDRIRIAHKQLFRNGAALKEPWAIHALDYEDAYRDNFPSEPSVPVYPQALDMMAKHVTGDELVVPPGRYFVLGDNRDQSLDSRYWGFISQADVIGRPVMIYGSQDVREGQQPSIVHERWHRLFRGLIGASL